MEQQILDILRQLFGMDVDTTCSQKNCEKWDSMNQLNLVVELEMAFDITLEPEEIGNMRSYDDIVRIVGSKLQ